MSDYQTFLDRKRIACVPTGITNEVKVHPSLFDFQRDIVRWACRRGRACIFSGCGTGKTRMSLEWAKNIGEPTLILAPLAVSNQTVEEGKAIDIPVKYCRDQSEIGDAQIIITNYQMMDKFDPSLFRAVVLDESSIIKRMDGSFRNQIIASFKHTPFKLTCTATPSPNDFVELGNHAEFMGAMTRTEMLSTFFVHDGGETQKWRLKGHAESEFWKWVCSWAVVLQKPSDLGYEDDGFILPELRMHEIIVSSSKSSEFLFPMEAQSLQERLGARRESIEERAKACYELINENQGTGPPIQSKILRQQRSKDARQSQSVVRGEQGQIRSDSQKIIPQGVLQNPSRKVDQDARATGQNQCSQESEICFGRKGKDKGASSSIGMAEGEPAQTENAEPEEIWDNSRADGGGNGSTGARMRDLRNVRYQKSTDISSSGPLPRNREVQGHSLRSVQQRDRAVEGQSETSENGGGLSGEKWVIWVALNKEQDLLESLFRGKCVSIRGQDDTDNKIELELKWRNGVAPIMITKPSIFGHGLNWQCCHNVIFLGLNDSWEQYYQAIRRCWRFGQTEPVNVWIVSSEAEGAVLANIKRKEVDAKRMFNAMVNNMHEINEQNIKSIERTSDEYKTNCTIGEKWEMNLEDCVEGVSRMESRSVGFSVFSPPFHSLFTYSNSDRDMGNCKNVAEFTAHFGFLIRELGRVMMPGRLVAVHCFDVPSMKERDGVIGLKDFSNEIRIAFESQGFIYHSRVTIWKDPVTQMQRTKALGLLHKTIRKDSAMSRQGLPDYLIVMRKEGVNPEPISHTHDQFPVSQWQQWASPVWMDINPSDTLQYRSAREHKDERHIAPLQLEVIRRAIMLWSNPGDLVLSPFAGIGSEGVVAVKHGRRFVGFELKLSYWNQAVANLKIIESEITSESLFKEAAV